MEQERSRKRLKRFAVTKDEVPFRMQDRDRDIIKHVHDNRFLTTKLITLLVGGSEQVVRTRLRKLFQNGYLVRIKGEYNKSTVCGLTDKAFEKVLIPHYGIEKDTDRITEKNKAVKYEPFIDHELLIAKIRVTLTLALRDRQDANLAEWIPDKERTNTYTVKGEGGREQTRTFTPDSFITINIEDEDFIYDKYFFLEADRHSKDNDRFLKQMIKYWEYQPAWEAEMGKNKDGTDRGFRVLVVGLSDKRVNNLRKKSKKADPQGVGSEMYWFTSETKFNPENPETILQPIWQTPKDDTLHHLLE